MPNSPALSILCLWKTSAMVTPEQFHRRSLKLFLHSFNPCSTPSRADKPSKGCASHFFCWLSLSQEQKLKASSLRGGLQSGEEDFWVRVVQRSAYSSYRDHPSTKKILNNMLHALAVVLQSAARGDDVLAQRINYQPSNSRFTVKLSHFETNIKTIIHSPGSFAPVYRSKDDQWDKREETDTRYHHVVFCVLPVCRTRLSYKCLAEKLRDEQTCVIA